MNDITALMTTNQTDRVSDDELDQMIWKLERDGGMTPKMLSLMRGLREVRRAKGVPVAWRYRYVHMPKSEEHGSHFTSNWKLCDSEDECNPSDCFERQALFAAPPAPTAPLELGDLLSMAVSAIEDLLEHTDPNTSYYSGVWADVPGRLRAAMLNHSGDTADMDEPVSNRDELNSPATPDGWIPVSERMPDPKSELRVCVYTPTPHEDIRYRFVPASLFKAVCRDATHWHYMSAPKEVG